MLGILYHNNKASASEYNSNRHQESQIFEAAAVSEAAETRASIKLEDLYGKKLI